MQAYQQFVVYPVRDKLPVFADPTETQVLRTVNRNQRLAVVRRDGAHYIVRFLGQIGFVVVDDVSSNHGAEPKLADGIASGLHDRQAQMTGGGNRTPNALESGGLIPADFTTRLLGYLIDYVIIIVLSVVVGALLVILFGAGSSENEESSNGLIATAYIAGTALAFCYVWLMDASGATVGKMVMGIQLVDDATGRAPGLGKTFLRTLVRLVSALALCLGFFWSIWDPHKKTWHDRAAGTSVVKYR